MPLARLVYYGFFILFYACATGVGLLSRLYIPDLGAIDPELALPRMADLLLPPVLVGLILAGIFSATMSTADSLVLSCSSALTSDLPKRPIDSVLVSKGATVLFTAAAVVLAIFDQQSVFDLVILAWSSLASAFVPLVLVYSLRGKPSEAQALLMMTVGVLVALGWRAAGLHQGIYEGLPGILSGLAVYLCSQVLLKAAGRRR
jgi:sodium/proline symporter